MTKMTYTTLHWDDIREGIGSYEFEGYLYGDSNVSFIWVELPPGEGPKLHRHPYEEIFVLALTR
jgi:quercetin dioxygenase-like cupin family protein